jgi:Flp pilus assembly protein TadG
MRRLAAAEFARRSSRKVRRASRGQTLLIFALTFTVLIGFMGLAIDSIRVYDMYARMQRAAEAGALAGVIYMPVNYTTNLTTSPGDDAVCRAWQETYKNSFGTGCTPGSSVGLNYCPTPVSATEIAVCPVQGQAYDLSVSITESIDLLFLGALNVAPLRFTVTATAQYLPPVQIASDPSGTGGTGSWGTFGECGNSGTSASAACTGSGSRNWAGNINGPGELKEQGDPLVTCEEGPSGPLTSVSDIPATSSPLYTSYVGMPTNHPQNPSLAIGQVPTNCSNPDTTGVFSGPAVLGQTHAGYAFYARMYKDTQTPASGPASVWIWNAPFNPTQPPSCNGRQSTGQTTYDIFYQYNCSGSSGSSYQYYPGTNCSGQNAYTCALTDPRMLFNVTYSIYQIDLANPTGGTLAATFTAYPLMQGSCGNGSYMLLASAALKTAAGCVSSACVANWCPLGDELGGVPSSSSLLWSAFQLQPGLDYRVMVVASDYGDPTNWNLGWGGHSYSMKLCPGSGVDQSNVQTCTPPTNATISGWNLSDTLFTFPGNGKGNGGSQTTEYPLGIIPASYIGRTVDVSLYDPGDLIGNAKGVSIYGAVPSLPGVSDPCTATSSQLKAAGYDPTINGKTFVFPNAERTTLFNNNIPALQPSYQNDLIYNGLWVDEQLTLPPTYTDTAWTLCATAPQLNDSDVLGIKVLALGQSPVHLIQ